MLKSFKVLFLFTILILSCEQENKFDPNIIIDKSIAASGGEFVGNTTIDFDFRDRHYKAIRKNGQFQYERVFKDSIGVIKDVLNNQDFQRFINDAYFAVTDRKEKAYTSSVNSVHYFSVLPYGLNDNAVNKTFLEQAKIKGKNYHKIQVTFNKEGGGEDFEDVFIYFINTETLKVDYLSYSYSESDGIGLRFREAYNERYVNGIRFVDYNNYKPKIRNTQLFDLRHSTD